MSNRSPEWDGKTTGRGSIVVYGRNSLRAMWNEHGDADKFQDVFEFEQSSMYPFTETAIGEYVIDEVLWDEDTQTIVVILDD